MPLPLCMWAESSFLFSCFISSCWVIVIRCIAEELWTLVPFMNILWFGQTTLKIWNCYRNSLWNWTMASCIREICFIPALSLGYYCCCCCYLEHSQCPSASILFPLVPILCLDVPGTCFDPIFVETQVNPYVDRKMWISILPCTQQVSFL